MKLLQSRRAIWGLNGLLLVAVALTVRPIRSWIDRSIVAHAIHPNLNVQEIRLHRDRLKTGHWLVEAQQFEWLAKYGDRCVGLSAPSAWLVVDQQPALRKVFNVPKALLRGSRLRLESLSSESQTASNKRESGPAIGSQSIWQQFLNERVSRSAWSDLRSELDKSVASDHFIHECGLIVDQWLTNREKLSVQAQTLLDGQHSLDNPLRNQEEIEHRLQQLDQLFEQQQQLRTQFTSIEERIANKLQQVGELYDEQRRQWDNPALDPGPLNDQVDPLSLEGGDKQLAVSPVERVAISLIEKAGRQVFDQFMSFPEVADLLCRSATDGRPHDHSRNYRPEGQPILSMDDLSASGIFRCDSTTTPFWFLSQCKVTHRAKSQLTTQAEFRFQFDQPPYSIRLRIAHDSPDQPFNEIAIELASYDKPTQPSKWGQLNAIEVDSPQWILTTNGDDISGSLKLDKRLMNFLADDATSLSKSITDAIESEGSSVAVELTLSGSWQSPTLSVASDQVPDWLKSAIEAGLKQWRQEVSRQTIAKIEQYFDTQLNHLDEALGELLDRTQQSVSKFDTSMVAVRNELNRQLENIGKTEFARSPESEVKR